MRLLYVEDNERLLENTTASLRDGGFAVDCVQSGEDAIHAAKNVEYDAIILDLALPDIDGLSVLKAVKAFKADVPFIICTARDGLAERIKGLDAGSDDYLVKPFDVAELLARIRAVLRRSGGALGVTLSAGNITFDTKSRAIEVENKAARLSKRELDLLELFMRRKGRILSKDTIENALYGFEEPPTPNAIEVATHRLRKKLIDLEASAAIHTLRGIGYFLDDGDQ